MTTLGREVLCMEINEVENGDFFGTTHTLASEKKTQKYLTGLHFLPFIWQKAECIACVKALRA